MLRCSAWHSFKTDNGNYGMNVAGAPILEQFRAV
jgi:hypothetical protein